MVNHASMYSDRNMLFPVYYVPQFCQKQVLLLLHIIHKINVYEDDNIVNELRLMRF